MRGCGWQEAGRSAGGSTFRRQNLSPSRTSFQLRGDPFDLVAEGWKLGSHNVPDNAGVDLRVAVDEDVTERDDASVLADALRQVGIATGELRQCFTDDLELSLDARPQQLIPGHPPWRKSANSTRKSRSLDGGLNQPVPAAPNSSRRRTRNRRHNAAISSR